MNVLKIGSLKWMAARKRSLIGFVLAFMLGGISTPIANSAAQYVTMQQRNKDLRDIANQFVRLQSRVTTLEICIDNLRVNKYDNFGLVNC
jgi:hypothetical protein